MPDRYTHLIDSDVDNAILKQYGLESNDDDKPKAPKICNICEMPNSPESNSCSKCGKPLDLKTAMELEQKEREQKEETQNRLSEVEKRLRMLEKSKRIK